MLTPNLNICHTASRFDWLIKLHFRIGEIECEYFITLKVKEMDDEEQSYHSLQEPSYRIETGNYEYRYVTP